MGNGPASTEIRHLRTLFALGAAGALTDGQLLERFATLGGDPAELAFAALVERHGPMVLRVARSALVDEHSADDAFQATFLILARKARSLWVRDSLGPWLHAVAYRVASQSRAAEARRRLFETAAARPEAHQPRERDRPDLARAIHQEIERLPHPYRLAVVSCHLEGLTQHEAAARLGWPVGTLQSRLARARQKLRDRLRRRGFAPPLGVIGGPFAPVPHALSASTARAASASCFGQATAGMVAPAVLVLIETTTRGMLMTKLKLGALALSMACGLAGSGVALGVGKAGHATEDPPASGKVEATRPGGLPAASPSLNRRPIDVDGDGKPDALVEEPREAGPLTPAADGPDFPVLMNFHAYNRGEPGPSMKPGIDALVAQGYPVMSVDIDKSPALRDRYRVTSLPTFLVVDGSGKVLARGGGMMSADRLAAFYNEAAAGEPGPPPISPPGAGNPPVSATRPAPRTSPTSDGAVAPRPLTTAVQILVPPRRGGTVYASGAIVDSNPERTLIVTAGAIFEKDRLTKGPGGTISYEGDILVNLAEPEVKDPGGLSSRVVYSELRADLLVYDRASGLSLIAIHPDRVLPASPVYQGPPLAVGAELRAMGCNPNGNIIAWPTQILNICADLTNCELGYSYPALVGSRKMADWWIGGGLFAPDGHLAGIALFRGDAADSNFFARPEAIKRLLDRSGVRKFYQEVWAGRGDEPLGRVPAPEPSSKPRPPDWADANKEGPPGPSPTRSDRERLDDLERKLDRVIKALEDREGPRRTVRPGGAMPAT